MNKRNKIDQFPEEWEVPEEWKEWGMKPLGYGMRLNEDGSYREILECKQCGYLWSPRPQDQGKCPRCKTPYYTEEEK